MCGFMNIQFEFDSDVAANTALYLLKKLGAQDILKLMFLIFYADRRHLIRYGMPITGDSYSATKHGPIPMSTYDLLCGGEKNFAREYFSRKGNKIRARRTAKIDEDQFSDSIVEVLDEICEEYGTLTAKKLMSQIRAEKEYQQLWGQDSTITAFPISYESILHYHADDKMKSIIAEQQEIEDLFSTRRVNLVDVWGKGADLWDDDADFDAFLEDIHTVCRNGTKKSG